jgi:uncharacterized protein YjgD (DUF1641 family)
MPETISVVSHLNALRDKLIRQKKSIQRLLNKPKNERNKRIIRQIIKEAKGIRKILKQHADNTKEQVVCPKCNHEFTINQPR